MPCSRSGGRWTCIKRANARQHYRFVVGKFCDESESASHGFDVAAKSRKQKVTSLFQPGNLVLANLESLGNALLGELVCAA